MVATIAVMLVVDPATDIKLLAWMILIHTTFNALQDVAVDADAIPGGLHDARHLLARRPVARHEPGLLQERKAQLHLARQGQLLHAPGLECLAVAA